MESCTIAIASTINLTLSADVLNNLNERRQRFPYLPEINQLVHDLSVINQHGGVPAVVGHDRRHSTEQLLLYSSSYYLALYDTEHHGGYRIAFVSPLNLYEHERLSKGTLRLQTGGWTLYPEARNFPQGSSNCWQEILHEWKIFDAQRQFGSPEQVSEESISPAAESYLNTLTSLIEVTKNLEEEKNILSTGITYRKVITPGARHDVPRDIYTFVLAETPQLDEKTMLRINGDGLQDLRGRIHMIEGKQLTLKFESLIDRRRIPEQGRLEPMINTSIYRAQQAAVERLRTRETRNPHLLNILAHQRYQTYRPDSISQSVDDALTLLTPEQFEAFQCALTVPDLLLVLGPPGTGKTRTITEIARYAGLRRQRVLMSSSTHKAVDNVLERIPDDLIVIRVGHESNISSKMREKMIDVQAEEMQKKIADDVKLGSAPLLRLLAQKSDIDAWRQRLGNSYNQLSQLETMLARFSQEERDLRAQIVAPFDEKRNGLTQSVQMLERKRIRRQTWLDRWQRLHDNASAKLHVPVLMVIYRLLVWFANSLLNHNQRKMQQLWQAFSEVKQAQADLSQQENQLLLASPAHQQCSQQVQDITTKGKNIWLQSSRVVQALQATLGSLVSRTPPLEPRRAQTLYEYLNWYTAVYKKFERQARLLEDWQRELEKPSSQFFPELLRYADVVGATCIGAATAKDLEDIEFDLAIVDEAGQIGLPDLLVPLVRARRALLVGDHNQLPPFVDSEVQTWLKNLSPETQQSMSILDEQEDIAQINDLLTKSAFEILFTRQLDAQHMVRFTKQGRMPKVVADFASHHFYQGQLGTFSIERMQHTLDQDPLFPCQFTLIDTSGAPPHLLWEQQVAKQEEAGTAGYINHAEAVIIADIAACYHRTGREWAVIVPYRAQARLIIRELRKRIHDQDIPLDEYVATVDSFQGGERQKIIYGFTRSNKRGKIGFLKELRRLNVAVTRAQQNIILIGNITMLMNTEDPKFNHVTQHLKQYSIDHGELLSYTAICQRLQKNSAESEHVSR